MAPYSFTIFTKKTMRKHIIPFYLEAPTQEILTESDDLNWNGVTSRIILPAFTANATVNIDAVAAQGKIMPGTILVLDQSGAVTAGVTVTIAYDNSPVITFDATSESATLLFFDDRDSQDDAGWEVIAKDASVGDLSAIDLDMSGSLTIDTDLFEVDSASRSIGFFGESAIEQPADATQAAVDLTAISGFPVDEAASVTDATHLEALADSVRALTVLVNRLRTDLTSLGLIKGQA